jgi:hypothetical protein
MSFLLLVRAREKKKSNQEVSNESEAIDAEIPTAEIFTHTAETEQARERRVSWSPHPHVYDYADNEPVADFF